MLKNSFAAGWSGGVLKSTHSESIVYNPLTPRLWGFDSEEKKGIGSGNIELPCKYSTGTAERWVHELKKEVPQKILVGSIVGEDGKP